jgi:YggT family protein
MALIGSLIILGLQIYIFVIIVQVALSWLVAFDIVNEKNEAAQNLAALTKRLTDPVFIPLRKYIPPIGGIDITPMVVFIGVQILISIVGSIFF